jgi:hypothetical protein
MARRWQAGFKQSFFISSERTINITCHKTDRLETITIIKLYNKQLKKIIFKLNKNFAKIFSSFCRITKKKQKIKHS